MSMLNRIDSLKGYWPTARALSRSFLSAPVLFLMLLSIPVRKSIFGRAPKKLWIHVPGMNAPTSFFVRDGMDVSVLREMFAEKEYEFPDVERPAPKSIADIGAHIGASAIYFSSRFPQARITAYEPDPDNFKLLVKNTSALKNITCVHVAVAPMDGRVSFRPSADASTRASMKSPGEDAAVDVRAISLGNIILGGVDIVKFDIEGDERDVFLATPRDSLERVGMYVGEVHHLIMGTTDKDIEEIFPNYTPLWHGAIVAFTKNKQT